MKQAEHVALLSTVLASPALESEFLIDNLLVRIHLIIEMILVDRPCAMEF